MRRLYARTRQSWRVIDRCTANEPSTGQKGRVHLFVAAAAALTPACGACRGRGNPGLPPPEFRAARCDARPSIPLPSPPGSHSTASRVAAAAATTSRFHPPMLLPFLPCTDSVCCICLPQQKSRMSPFRPFRPPSKRAMSHLREPR